MVWPIPPLPTDRTNTTPQFDSHVADHNALADAVNELAARAVVDSDIDHLVDQVAALSTLVASQPTGLITRSYQSMDQNFTATPQRLSGAWLQWTADPSRWYRVSMTCPRVQLSTPAGLVFMGIDNGIVSTYGTALRQATVSLAVNGIANLYVDLIEAGLSGNQTRGVWCAASGGGAAQTLVDGLSRISIAVEDLGAV